MSENNEFPVQVVSPDFARADQKQPRSSLRKTALRMVTVPSERKNKNAGRTGTARLRLTKLLRNPLVIVLPIVGVLWLGWNFYLQATRDLNVSAENLLSGGSFDDYGPNGVPTGWQLRNSGVMDMETAHPQGYVGGQALTIKISDYKSGDAELVSPNVPLQKSADYLFKGFYRSNATFDLLARFTYADGSSNLQMVRTFGQSDSSWTTLSDAFDTGAMHAQSVQFVYRFYGSGSIELDDTYLETNNEIALPAEVTTQNNLFSNTEFVDMHGTMPRSWLAYHSGENTAKFALAGTGMANPYLHLETSEFRSGEAKWQQAPLTADPLHRYGFGVRYRSSEPAYVVVEYVLADGNRKFDTIATLHPADEWTDIHADFQAPSDAATMFASVILRSNGTLDTSNYLLNDITKSGPIAWQRPLVSLTFDDGDESAYQNGLPILRQYKLPATFYVNPATVDTPNFMATSQLLDLKKQGSEIASQGYDNVDLTTVNANRLSSELKESRDYLNRTFSQHTTDFASPFGAVDAQTLPVIKSVYSSQRGNVDGVNTRQNFDPYNLRVLYIGSETSLHSVQSDITEAQSENGWLILVYHQVGSETTSQEESGRNTNLSIANFTSQIKAIAQSDITVLPVNAALREVEDQ
jgi:hypothetical protein